jgi:DNA topoisomerase-1
VGRGQYGPYVKFGAKYASIKDDDPFTLTLPRALEIVETKLAADRERTIKDFPEHGIQVLKGRYGPYVTDKKRNAKVPKDRDPASLTLEECQALLAAAPERGGGRFGRRKAKPAAAAAPETTAASKEAAARPKSRTEAAAKPGSKPRSRAKAPAAAAAPAARPKATKKKPAPRAARDKAAAAKE